MMVESGNSLTDDLEMVLFDEAAIRKRVRMLGDEISAAYKGKELIVIAVINGALVFTADLIRELNLVIKLECVRASSYQYSTAPTQSPKIIDSIRLDVKGADILLIDDILDTGNTLSKVSETLWTLQPNSLKTCVLLDKKSRRLVNIEADFVGFEIPDEFVVGYGLDFAESYRHLPYIGVLKKELNQI